MRIVLGILFGIVAAMAIVAGIEWAESALYPLPTLDVADPDMLAGLVTNMPLPAKILIVVGWLLGAIGGAWLSLRVCDRSWTAWVVVLGVIVAAVANVATLPHPVWMQACAVLLPVLGGGLATRVHRKPYAGEALLG
ncbi:hypothetical protein BH10PSE15_BH10PSE15_14870 [soil metagenome]